MYRVWLTGSFSLGERGGAGGGEAGVSAAIGRLYRLVDRLGGAGDTRDVSHIPRFQRPVESR